jgi:hypothetical protein
MSHDVMHSFPPSTDTTLATQCTAELSPLVSLKETLDRRAETFATLVTVGGVAGLMAGSGVYYWLTYIYLSWDLMEPVTYFTFNFFSVVAYFWWFRTNTNYSYPALRSNALEKRREALYTRTDGFDIEKFDSLVDEVADLEQRIEDVDRQLTPLDA